MDLSAPVRQYAGRGSDAHHPGMLLALLIYGYATGVHASCAIERASYDSVAEAAAAQRYEQAQAQFEAKQAERERRKEAGRRPAGPPPAPPGAEVDSGSDDRCIYTDR